MGVGASLYMYACRRKKFTFDISSPDEFLVQTVAQKPKHLCHNQSPNNPIDRTYGQHGH